MELGEHLLQAWMVGLDKWLAKHWPASPTCSLGLPSIVTHFLSSLFAPQKAGSPLVDFLSLLFQFTFLQKSPEAILACLEVWAAVCDYLEGSKEAGKVEVIGRYTEALAALVSELLRRMHAVLANLDDDRIGEDGITEWQAFLNACLELVMRIAELLPEQTLATVEVVWRDTSAAYLGLENQVEGSNGQRRLNTEQRIQVSSQSSQLHSFLTCLV